MEIERLDLDAATEALPALAELLCDAVADGASVGFLRGLDAATAESWWRDNVVAGVRSGGVVLFAAFEGDSLLGSVHLRLAEQPNAPHRAEMAKLIVHTAARRRGVGRALLASAEAVAQDLGRTLLLLDTTTGSAAEQLYRAAGYTVAGRIPAYSLLPDGAPAATTFLIRHLVAPPSPDAVLRIRGARVDDSGAMGAIHVRAWQSAYRGAMPDEFLDNIPEGLRESQWRETLTYPRAADRYWVLDRDGEVVGFAQTGTSRDRDAVTGSAEIFAIYVRPEEIGTGMGRRLLEHALADLTRRGARWITAWVFEGAERARHVFEAARMQPDGGERMFTVLGEPMREMRYRLTVPS
jgi:ribosomal protein S18 acetylase RimI-like enzyme